MVSSVSILIITFSGWRSLDLHEAMPFRKLPTLGRGARSEAELEARQREELAPVPTVVRLANLDGEKEIDRPQTGCAAYHPSLAVDHVNALLSQFGDDLTDS